MASGIRLIARHGAIPASLLVHGAAVGLLLLKLETPSSPPAQADIAPIVVAIVSAPAPTQDPALPATEPPAPQEPPPQPPSVVERPPPIESTAAETTAPLPPPKIEPRNERKPRRERVHPAPSPEPVVAHEAPLPSSATSEPVQAAAPAQAAVAQSAPPAGPPANYMAQLHSALERSKQYPKAARSQHMQGRAMLRFAIDRSGNVIDYRIEKSSGYDILDREVVAMIRRASPLPPMPAEMAADKLEVVVPIPFTLR